MMFLISNSCFQLTYKSYIQNMYFPLKYAQKRSCLTGKHLVQTVLNKTVGGFWCERTIKGGLF